MNGLKLQVLAAVLFFSFCAAAAAGNISKATGMFTTPEAATDADPASFATLKRNSADAPFVVYVYLAEAMGLDKLSFSIDRELDTGAFFLEASGDIVNWSQFRFKLELETKDGVVSGTATPEVPVTAQYLKLSFKPKDGALETKVFDIRASRKALGKNEIKSILVEEVSKYDATIVYSTLIPASSQVRYSPWRPSFDIVLFNQSSVTDHKVTLENLLEGTDYFFQVLLPADEVYSEFFMFRTAGKPLPLVLNIALDSPEPTRAKITLDGNTELKWTLWYGKFAEGMDTVEKVKNAPDARAVRSDALERSHSFDIAGISPRARYFFLAEAEDDEGRATSTELKAFDTPAVNLALGKPVAGTFLGELPDPLIEATDNPIGRITDGDETYFSGFAKGRDSSAFIQFATVDLGEVMDVAEAQIVWSRLAVPEAYTVKYSAEDPQAWTTILEVEAGKAPPGVTVSERRSSRGDPLIDVVIPVNAKARRIRLDIPAGATIKSGFDFRIPILAEIKALAP